METDQQSAYAMGIIMPISSTVFITLRLLAKHHSKRGYAADDVCLVIGALLVWVMAGVFLAGVVRGSIGDENYPETSPKMQELAKITWACLFVERLAFPIIKIGIVLWYRSIFVGRTFNIISKSLIVFLALWSIAFCSESIFQCGTSPAAEWSSSPVAERHPCIDLTAQQAAFETIDFVSDIAVVALPIPFVWRLKISTGKKIGVSLTFLMAILSTITAAIRMAICIGYSYGGLKRKHSFPATMSVSLLWTLISASTGIIAATLPTLRPLFLTSSSIIQSTVGSVRASMAGRLSWENSLHQRFKSEADKPKVSEYEVQKVSVVTVTQERTAGEESVPSLFELSSRGHWARTERWEQAWGIT